MKKELTIKNDHTASFSVRARLQSLRHAFNGLNHFFSAEHNAIIHLLVTICVVMAAIFFDLGKLEFLIILLATGAVWTAELFNSAIERLCDLVTKNVDPRIKFIKDVSAAAVLVTSIAAFLTGLIIFLPKILS